MTAIGRFAGKTVIVTGGASGIGSATARRFGAEGATVVVADISDEAGAAVATQIADAGGTAHYRRTDVATESGWADLAAFVHTTIGPADVVFSNAFALHQAPATEQS